MFYDFPHPPRIKLFDAKNFPRFSNLSETYYPETKASSKLIRRNYLMQKNFSRFYDYYNNTTTTRLNTDNKLINNMYFRNKTECEKHLFKELIIFLDFFIHIENVK